LVSPPKLLAKTGADDIPIQIVLARRIATSFKPISVFAQESISVPRVGLLWDRAAAIPLCLPHFAEAAHCCAPVRSEVIAVTLGGRSLTPAQRRLFAGRRFGGVLS